MGSNKGGKTVNATTVITFMGLELDSMAMEARHPHEKLTIVGYVQVQNGHAP